MGSYEESFPSFEIGVSSIGEAVDSDTWAVESVPGVCPGETPIDQYLLSGGSVRVEELGGRIHVVLLRSLGERTYVDKGVTHRVYRKGTQKAVGEDLFQTVAAALVAQEEVLEGSLMSVP